MTPEETREIFGDADEAVLAAANKIAEGIYELIPLMNGADGAGTLRVAAVLVDLGKRLAART